VVENREAEIIILRRSQVEKRTGLTKSGIYYLIREGIFPHPIKIGTRAVGWVEQEVDSWLAQKIQNRALHSRG